MGRSLIGSDQVIDIDFVSHEEHGNPEEIEHRLTMNVDFPTTYSGSVGKLLRVRDDEQGLEIVATTVIQEYPRYYIEPNIETVVNAYGQYTINETRYIEIAGSVELGIGAMLIIK